MPPRPSLGRARLSCLPCRKRKSKCDEKKPCSSCILRGSGETCFFPHDSQAPQPTGPSRACPANGHTHAHKKQRLSINRDERSTTTPSDPQTEIANLRHGLTRLEDMIRSHPVQASSPWTCSSSPSRLGPLPARLDRLDHVLAVLPCQSDCETLFEYLLQEAEWMVTCVSVQWLHPIWCRFVYGGRVTRAESIILVTTLAVAALLLDESSHVYYPTAASLGPLHDCLIDFVADYLSDLPAWTKASVPSPRNTINELAILAIAFEYLTFSAHRRKRDLECWTLVRRNLHQLVQSTDNFFDEASAFWQGLNIIETEYARRVAWQCIISERWGGTYHNPGTSSPFCKQDFNVAHPDWICSSLSAPFRARPSKIIDCKEQAPLEFRTPSKSVARMFRFKQDDEAKDAERFAELFIGLSEHVSSVAVYIADIEAWRKLGQGSAGGSQGSDVDHRREALLHHGIVLSNDIRAWQRSFQSYCAEPDHLDASDYAACRKASQAAMIHVGRRQLLNIILGAWVTEKSVMVVDSPLLAQLQREAFDNARDAVRSIGVTRVLLSCATVVHNPFASLGFFSAATTLAIPLLGASRQRQGTAANASKDCPHVFHIDKLPDFGNLVREQNDATARPSPSPPPSPFYPASAGSQSTPRHSTATSVTTMTTASSPGSVLKLEEMQTLAPDILRILDFLPKYKAHLLRDEARQRLAMLVDTYGIGQQDLPHLAGHTMGNGHTMSNDWPVLRGVEGMQQAHRDTLSPDSPSPSFWTDVRGNTVLDSLVALDDTWWDQLLSANALPPTHPRDVA